MNRILKRILPATLACCAVAAVPCMGREPAAAIRVDASTVEAHITPYLYGACIEDVNHEIYGGLYDQKIFGESFEEPVPNPRFDECSTYEGSWQVVDGAVHAAPHGGAKLVYDPLEMEAGTVETEIRFMGGNPGDNAGLLVGVSEPGNGADNFYGYEISLSADGRRIVVGKHRNDFSSMGEVAVSCDPAAWNRLCVETGGGKLRIGLNGMRVMEVAADDPLLARGKVALRTWNSEAQFRNVKVSEGGRSRTLAFRTTPALPVSRQWDAFTAGDARAVYAHNTEGGYNGPCSQSMEFVSGQGAVGIANASLNRWGIAVREGQRFEGRIYLKGEGEVVVALQSADGTREYASQRLSGIGSGWGRFPFALTSSATDAKARFVVYLDRPGRVDIDQATLMTNPEDQFRGLPLRRDIGEAMVDEGLTFLRYGGTMINIEGYRFKKMIGDRDRRPPYRGHWYRYSTNGFGIEDFLQFCEKAGFTAAFAVNIEETPEDMADMIEYLNGPATSEWGRKRAENGHPEPYGVKYIGIGNEEVLFHGDRADEYDHYVERFLLLHDAIKGVDPTVKLVATAWWRPDSPSMERTFRALDGKADFWDYHPWADQLGSGRQVLRELKQMQELFLKWNPETKIRCAIFEENGSIHSMQRVLGHVTVQNAVRRMGDFVLTSCAANALQPYGQNDNGWDQGQVFFTPDKVWGMPPYYAQQMAAANHLPLLVASETTGAETLDVTATRSEEGDRVVLHIANTGAEPVRAKLDVKGLGGVSAARMISLAGELDAVNTPEEPERIVPVGKPLKKAAAQILDLKPCSYTIVVLER